MILVFGCVSVFDVWSFFQMVCSWQFSVQLLSSFFSVVWCFLLSVGMCRWVSWLWCLLVIIFMWIFLVIFWFFFFSIWWIVFRCSVGLKVLFIVVIGMFLISQIFLGIVVCFGMWWLVCFSSFFLLVLVLGLSWIYVIGSLLVLVFGLFIVVVRVMVGCWCSVFLIICGLMLWLL